MRVSIAIVAAVLAVGACGGDEPVSRQIGARCDLSNECDERCLTGDNYPGGFCSITCDSQLDCPGGTICVDDQGGVCLFTCKQDPDCAYLGDGWSCRSEPAKPSGQVMVCSGGG